MKKFFYFLLALPLVFAACGPEENPTPAEKDPVLNLVASVDVAAEGGVQTLSYTLENAKEGLELNATSEVEWIENIAVAEKITFEVLANEGEAREATLVVTYGDITKNVAVKQAKKNEAPKTPVFELVGEGVVEYAWNDPMGEVEFLLENPVDGVSVSAKSSASWLSQFQVADNKIKFAIEENRGDAREAKVTAEYGMMNFQFTVKQGAYVAPDPVFTVTSETTLEFDAEGGNGTIEYTLENPVEGVNVEAVANVEWISGFAVADGKVDFAVAANDTDFVRDGKITLSYGELVATIIVKQAFEGAQEGVTYASMKLNKVTASAGSDNTWNLIFFETVENLGNDNMTRITVQLPKSTINIPTGSYSSEAGNILLQTNRDATGQLSFFRYNSVAQLINKCTLEVELDKENYTTKLSGMITTGDGVYKFEWDGEVEGFMYEEIGDEGITNWKNCYIYSQWSSNKCSNLKAHSADGVSINLYVTNNVDPVAQGLGEGVYTVDNWNSKADRFIEGGPNGGSKVNGVTIELGGTMTVTYVSEGYQIEFNLVDANGNEWKGTYVGEVPFTSYTDL